MSCSYIFPVPFVKPIFLLCHLIFFFFQFVDILYVLRIRILCGKCLFCFKLVLSPSFLCLFMNTSLLECSCMFQSCHLWMNVLHLVKEILPPLVIIKYSSI